MVQDDEARPFDAEVGCPVCPRDTGVVMQGTVERDFSAGRSMFRFYGGDLECSVCGTRASVRLEIVS